MLSARERVQVSKQVSKQVLMFQKQIKSAQINLYITHKPYIHNNNKAVVVSEQVIENVLRKRQQISSFESHLLVVQQIKKCEYYNEQMDYKQIESLYETIQNEVDIIKINNQYRVYGMYLVNNNTDFSINNNYVVQKYYGEIQMDKIAGFDLSKLLFNNWKLQIPEQLLCHLIEQVKIQQDKNIVHRDLKPENIMVSFDLASVHIVDFGVSKYNQSVFKTIVGSPLYMAPEIIQDSALYYGKECDLWSLGFVLYECLCYNESRKFEFYPKSATLNSFTLFNFIRDPQQMNQNYVNQQLDKIQNKKFQAIIKNLLQILPTKRKVILHDQL